MILVTAFTGFQSLWGFLKDNVNRNIPHAVEELKGEITSAVDSITE
jgi:hypothetical protein